MTSLEAFMLLYRLILLLLPSWDSVGALHWPTLLNPDSFLWFQTRSSLSDFFGLVVNIIVNFGTTAL